MQGVWVTCLFNLCDLATIHFCKQVDRNAIWLDSKLNCLLVKFAYHQSRLYSRLSPCSTWSMASSWFLHCSLPVSARKVVSCVHVFLSAWHIQYHVTGSNCLFLAVKLATSIVQFYVNWYCTLKMKLRACVQSAERRKKTSVKPLTFHPTWRFEPNIHPLGFIIISLRYVGTEWQLPPCRLSAWAYSRQRVLKKQTWRWIVLCCLENF